ncbi:MAG TPA: MBL fold metallo-hydrolase [Pyrinomonadaceae bacterium]|nr:MBL fold metallo-hydrolase [Pyrinomonadaceae bacterium]
MKKFLGLVLCALTLALLWPAAEVGANPFEYSWQQLAPGVWAAIRQDPFELPQEGNSVFVVTERGVVIFDAGGSPAMGESIVAKVRSVTDKPVTHVVISHWHGDHMRGLQAIKAAFPQAQVFAHPHSRDLIVETQERWLKRRVTMVPNIRKNVAAALSNNKDMSGRPLIKEEQDWLQKGLSITDQLDRENNRTAYVVPDATFDDRMTLYAGGREIQFLHLGNAHTAGDIVMWLPQEKIIATGDVVTGPIPLMPSPYTNEYVGVLNRIKALGFKTLVPGHGPVETDSQYVELLIETVQSVSAQMKTLVAQGLSQDAAVAKVDFSGVEPRFTHGDPFLRNRFQDYVAGGALATAAYLVETGKGPNEVF